MHRLKFSYVFKHAAIVSVAPVARYIAEEIAENPAIVITEHVHTILVVVDPFSVLDEYRETKVSI